MLLARKLMGNKKTVYSFNMTAEYDDGGFGAASIGYDPPDQGSIDAEPIEGAFIDYVEDKLGAMQISIDGDITATLAGYSEIYIDGVPAYTGGAWSLSNGDTRYQIGGSVPPKYGFVDGVTYLIELKEP